MRFTLCFCLKTFSAIVVASKKFGSKDGHKGGGSVGVCKLE